jgi:hypothetical protein
MLRDIATKVAVKSPAMIEDKLAKMQSQQDSIQNAYTSLQSIYLQSWAKNLQAHDAW